MNLEETLEKFEKVLNDFCDKEKYLLEHNLSERCISHKLAEYLKEEFADFHVDCEYNKKFNFDEMVNDPKELIITRKELDEIAVVKTREGETFSVFPDIIIHERKSDNNHLIIEIKKTSNNSLKDKNFDRLKLKKYTESYVNQLGYKLGIFLEIGVLEKTGENEMCYFQNGDSLTFENLKDWE